jgi:hypothetical protein
MAYLEQDADPSARINLLGCHIESVSDLEFHKPNAFALTTGGASRRYIFLAEVRFGTANLFLQLLAAAASFP